MYSGSVAATGTQSAGAAAALAIVLAARDRGESLVAVPADQAWEARLVPGMDVVAVANLRPERRQAIQDLRNAGSALNVLMGRDPLDPITIARDLDVERDRIDADDALALALRRPDLQELFIALLGEDNPYRQGSHAARHRYEAAS